MYVYIFLDPNCADHRDMFCAMDVYGTSHVWGIEIDYGTLRKACSGLLLHIGIRMSPLVCLLPSRSPHTPPLSVPVGQLLVTAEEKRKGN